jgi:hypothetical protein
MTIKLPKPGASNVAIAILAIFTILQPTHAQHFDPSWRLHVEFAVVDPSGDFATVDVGGSGVVVGFDSAVGAGLRGEYQFSKLLGVEIGLRSAHSGRVASE